MLKHRLLLPEQIGPAFNRIEKYLPDNLRNVQSLAQLYLQRDSMFFELGDFQGLFWFTGLIPGFKAEVHIVLWDEQLRGRGEEAKTIINHWKQFFRLRRIAAYIPDLPEYTPALKYAEKIGFHYEGLIKYVDQYEGQLINIHSLALTEEA